MRTSERQRGGEKGEGKRNGLNRLNSYERFSSYESPPQSDEECFSEYESPRHKDIYVEAIGESFPQNIAHFCHDNSNADLPPSSYQLKRHQQIPSNTKSYQIHYPPHPPHPNHHPPHPNHHPPHYPLHYPPYYPLYPLQNAYQELTSIPKYRPSPTHEPPFPKFQHQNRFNYLNHIPEESIEQLSSSLLQIHSNQKLAKQSSYIKIEETQRNQIAKIAIQEEIVTVKLQEAQLKINNLQKQNLSLKQKVLQLQEFINMKQKKDLIQQQEQRAKHQQIEKQFEIERNQSNSSRYLKRQLLEEISHLQEKCGEVRTEMINHKIKYQKFVEETEQERRKQQEIVQQEYAAIKQSKQENQFKDQFIEVFMKMLTKISVSIDETWSLKKQIAVGWKVIKLLVKKALKLGVQLPSIVNKDELNCTKFQME